MYEEGRVGGIFDTRILSTNRSYNYKLAATLRRNFDYDRFWVVFPLTHADGTPVLPPDVREAELVVRIYEKEGRVRWSVPDSIRR